MYGFNVTMDTFNFDNRPVSPSQNATCEQWWWVSDALVVCIRCALHICAESTVCVCFSYMHGMGLRFCIGSGTDTVRAARLLGLPAQ